jgi:hypothetical protein
VLAQRRLAYDQMTWQTPTLAFTAEAFLFTIGLGPGVTAIARGLAATMAFVVAALSIHLLRKHEHMELIDSMLLEQIEDEWFGFAVHVPARDRRALLPAAKQPRTGWFVELQAPRWWIRGQMLFAFASVVIVVVTVVRPSLL